MSTLELPVSPPDARTGQRDRAALVRRARVLAGAGLAWHFAEAAIAIAAGVAAGSIALIGFGADSLVESFAGIALLWRFAGGRSDSVGAERRAQRLIGASFFVIAAYVGVEALRALISGQHPDASPVGIALAIVTLATMPPLARAKARVGAALESAATASEGRQNMLCAYLAAALLFGLGANALLGLWWMDPLTALVIAAVAVREGRDAVRGKSCCVTPAACSGASPR